MSMRYAQLLFPRCCYSISTKFALPSFKLYKLDAGPSSETTCSVDEAKHYLNQMMTIRRMETSAGNLYKEKQIRGFCHLTSGQEAVNVGIYAALRPDDCLISAYRIHGIAYTFGVSVHKILAELMGRKSGCAGGKGGSMHLYAENFYGGNGIVGAQVPLGAGVAFALKYKGTDAVCVTMYGDGASNQGQVFEAFNMAKLWNLPCIFVCENNKFGMGTSVERSSASTEYYKRGDYIPGVWVDAMDVLSVREAVRFATNWCRHGNGPMLLEMETYRYHGHSMSDPGTSYRSRDDVQKVRRDQDPITLFSKRLLAHDLITEEERKEMEQEVKKNVSDAEKKARQDAEPDIEEMFKCVYVDNSPYYHIRGCSI